MQIRFAIIILAANLLGLSACQQANPDHQLDFLSGSWIRVSSSDPRNDSMIILINIKADSAILTSVPDSSNFRTGINKWTKIAPTARDAPSGRGDFILQDLSGDTTNTYEATLFINSDTTLELKSLVFPSAPGGTQNWKKL